MARKTVYCVQAYGGRPGGFVKGMLRQFGAPKDALEVGEELSARVPGVVVFSVTGEPDFDTWEEPVVLARHGIVPDVAYGTAQ